MTNYDSAVSEARSLVKRSQADQWRLAELTWQQLDAGVTGNQWALDIGVDPSYVYRIRAVWQKYVVQSQGVADLVSYDKLPKFNDAYKDISPSSAYQPRQPQPLEPVYGPPPPNVPQDPVERAAAAREYLADPEVAQAVYTDPSPAAVSARANIARAQIEQSRRRDEQPPAQDEPALAEGKAQLDLAAACYQFARQVQQIMPRLPEGPVDTERLGYAVSRAEMAADVIKAYLATGKPDVLTVSQILGDE